MKTRLALEEIVKLEKIEATEDELNAEFEKMASTYSMDLEKIKELVPAEDIKLDLAVNKAIDLIKSSAEISESARKRRKLLRKRRRLPKRKKTDEEKKRKRRRRRKQQRKSGRDQRR